MSKTESLKYLHCVCPFSDDGNSIFPIFQSFYRTTGDFSHSHCPHPICQKTLLVPSLGYVHNLTTSHHIHHSYHSINHQILSPGLLPYTSSLFTCAPYILLSAKQPGDAFNPVSHPGNPSQVMLLKHDSDHLPLLQSCQWLLIYLTVTSKIFTVVSTALGTSSPTTLSLVTWLCHTGPTSCSWDRQGISA